MEPTFEATPEPTPDPTESNDYGPPINDNGISMMFLVEENDKSKLPLEKGYHHTIWAAGEGPVEPEVWFHEPVEYNIAVEVGTKVDKLELEGFYYRYFGTSAGTEYDEKLKIKKKTFTNVKTWKWYGFLDGTEDRSKKSSNVPNWRQKWGYHFLEAGEFHLTATPYDKNGKKGAAVDVVVDIRANAQRDPIFDEGLILEIEEWKDIQKWQLGLRGSNNKGDDFVTARKHWGLWRIGAVTYFNSWVYIVAEKWGTIFKVHKNDNSGTTDGMSLFLDVKEGIESSKGGDSKFGNGKLWHSGLRSVAFHPNGNDDEGRCYVTAMEEAPSSDSKKKKLPYIERTTNFNPIDEDAVILEFQYKNGKGLPYTYRLLFRIECPVFDHTIRQLMFGPDDHLYILMGDGSVESLLVGDAQNNDGLGKIYRIDPLDGKSLDAELEWGQYSTKGNPWDFSNDNNRPNPAVPGPLKNKKKPKFGPVPKETYAIGFRNPHTMTFTKAGDFIIGEAGRDTFEEVNVIVEGGNYGWSYYDGTYVHSQLLGSKTNALFYSSTPVENSNDECPKCNFRWPALTWGHNGFEGMGFNSIAMAGGHVVENWSPVHKHGKGKGKYFLCDFPVTGKFFYAYVPDLLTARDTATKPLSQHKPAPMYHAKFKYKGKVYATFRDVSKEMSNDYVTNAKKRVDLRMGQDSDGTLYIFSKETGKIFKVTNSEN